MKFFKRFIQILGALLLTIVLVFVVAKVNGYIQLKEFYDNSDKEFMIPGLFDNFIPQGMDYDDAKDSFIITGYQKGTSKATAYLVDKDRNAKKFYFKNSKDEECMDHCGGVTIYKNYLLVSGGDGSSKGAQFVYTFNLSDVYSVSEGKEIKSLAETSVAVGTAFVNAVDDTLYVGEFNHDGSALYDVKKTTERSWMQEDTKAFMLSYTIKDDGTIEASPNKAYAIPDDVQGMAITKEGNVLFSKSYGINPGFISVYEKMPDTVSKVINIDGVDTPLYYFNESIFKKDIKVSPMIEAIVYSNNKVYTLNESASLKYFYGLFFRGSSVYSYNYNHE